MPARKINVHIHPPQISCDPDGGNVYSKNREDQLQWDGHGAAFTMVFKDFLTGQPKWPFREDEPRWPVDDTGTLTLEDGMGPMTYVKYSVTAPNCAPLDPIIIIDRR